MNPYLPQVQFPSNRYLSAALHSVGWIVSFGTIFAAVAAEAESSSKDEAGIRSQIEGYAAARQKGDGPAQAQFYTEDADEWPSFALEMVRGREAIAKPLAGSPNPSTPPRVVKNEPIQINSLKPDIALVDTLYGSGPGGNPVGHAFYVMVKTDGRWLIRSARIVRFHSS